MIGDILSSGIGTAIIGYESLVGMFGSPAMLIAIASAMIAVAVIELYVRNCRKRAKEAV
jgi:hypothetical protein